MQITTVYIPTPCWLKHLCSIRALVSMSFFLFLSLSLWGYLFGVQMLSEFTFLPRLLRPSQEGALRLHPIERVPEASVNRASPVPGALLAFCVNQEISASFSLLYFLISRLQTTRFWSIKGPQQVEPRTGAWYTYADSDGVTPGPIEAEVLRHE